MDRNIDLIITNFRNLSSRIYEGIYSDFKRSVKNIDRGRDENVFQQAQSRYMDELEKQLQLAAKEMVQEIHENSVVKKLQHDLAGQVTYLLSEFLHKAKSM